MGLRGAQIRHFCGRCTSSVRAAACIAHSVHYLRLARPLLFKCICATVPTINCTGHVVAVYTDVLGHSERDRDTKLCFWWYWVSEVNIHHVQLCIDKDSVCVGEIPAGKHHLYLYTDSAPLSHVDTIQ